MIDQAPDDTTAPVLVFGIGNPWRGDDAIGPLLIERLAALLAADTLAGVAALTEMQLQVEHALDLRGRQRVIFIDAARDQGAPVRWQAVTPAAVIPWSSHSLSPDALAGVYRTLFGPPPELRLLAVAGADFRPGAGLSATGARHLTLAWQALLAELRVPVPWSPPLS